MRGHDGRMKKGQDEDGCVVDIGFLMPKMG